MAAPSLSLSSSSSSFSSLILQPLKPTRSITSRRPRLSSALTLITCAGSGGSMESDERNRNPKRRMRKGSKYGTSRRSVIKKSFSQEQVTFTAPPSADPTVAIIGGGISGLACALTLEERGIRSTVFDTGMHGLGGRLGTRMVEFESQELVFDHAAQFFTVSDPRFQKFVDRWLKEGLIREWKGQLGQLEIGGLFNPIPYSTARYVGVRGMRPLADSILHQSSMVKVVRPCWVSKLDPFNGMWHLREKEEPQGYFDAIVIAHNGKCANRLLSSSGLPLLFKQMKRLELSSIWALMAAFKDPLPAAFEGAFVKGADSISWMANNTIKLFPLQSGLPHCWTFFSTAAYGRQNKVPQENIPTVTAERVKAEMLEGVETALGLSEGSLQRPFYTRVQLWGAALPTNSPRTPCIFDPHGRAGICGDWLLGSSIEAAVLSGTSLAHHMADYFQSGGSQPTEFEVGLHNDYDAIDGHDIGQFHGMDSGKKDLAVKASAICSR